MNWLRFVRTLLHFGKYSCSVCNRRVYGFEPLPEYYRDNATTHGYIYSVDDAETLNHEQYSCPVCGASDRDRLYALFINKYLREHPGLKMSMLEIAPSKPLSEFIRRTGQVDLRTADKFMEGVDDKVDITDMRSYPDRSFDSFICSHVLEHVADDRKALSELYRILKPGGWGILMVPIVLGIDAIDEDPTIDDEGERWRRFGQNDHVRLYSKNGFLSRVRETGFEIDQFGRDYFSTEVFQKSAVAKESILYVVTHD